MALGNPAVSQPYAPVGAGTALIGTYWEPSLQASIQTSTNFLRFADQAVADTPLLLAGQGQEVHFSYTDPIAVDGVAINGTERTPTGTQGLVSNTATVAEYGKGVNLSGYQGYLTNPNYSAQSPAAYYQAMNAIRSLTDWSIATADYKVGEALLASGTTNFININSATSVTLGTSEGGTYDFTAATIMDMQAQLGALGIAGRAELGGRWGLIGPAGAFARIRQIDGIQRDAASLGIDTMYLGGFSFAWQNFVFFDQIGSDAAALNARPAADTVGTCILIGGAAVVHDNTIGAGFSVNAPDWMVYYSDYGQDNGRTQRVQANFKAITSQTVTAASKHRVWLIRSYQNV